MQCADVRIDLVFSREEPHGDRSSTHISRIESIQQVDGRSGSGKLTIEVDVGADTDGDDIGLSERGGKESECGEEEGDGLHKHVEMAF